MSQHRQLSRWLPWIALGVVVVAGTVGLVLFTRDLGDRRTSPVPTSVSVLPTPIPSVPTPIRGGFGGPPGTNDYGG